MPARSMVLAASLLTATSAPSPHASAATLDTRVTTLFADGGGEGGSETLTRSTPDVGQVFRTRDVLDASVVVAPSDPLATLQRTGLSRETYRASSQRPTIDSFLLQVSDAEAYAFIDNESILTTTEGAVASYDGVFGFSVPAGSVADYSLTMGLFADVAALPGSDTAGSARSAGYTYALTGPGGLLLSSDEAGVQTPTIGRVERTIDESGVLLAGAYQLAVRLDASVAGAAAASPTGEAFRVTGLAGLEQLILSVRSQPVPEPTAAVTLVLAGAVLLRRARHH